MTNRHVNFEEPLKVMETPPQVPVALPPFIESLTVSEFLLRDRHCTVALETSYPGGYGLGFRGPQRRAPTETWLHHRTFVSLGLHVSLLPTFKFHL